MSLKKMCFLYIFILLTGTGLWGQVVIKDSIGINELRKSDQIFNIVNNDSIDLRIMHIKRLLKKEISTNLEYSNIDSFITYSSIDIKVKAYDPGEYTWEGEMICPPCSINVTYTIPVVTFQTTNKKYLLGCGDDGEPFNGNTDLNGREDYTDPLSFYECLPVRPDRWNHIKYIKDQNQVQFFLIAPYRREEWLTFCPAVMWPYIGYTTALEFDLYDQRPIINTYIESDTLSFYEFEWEFTDYKTVWNEELQTYTMRHNSYIAYLFVLGLHHFDIQCVPDTVLSQTSIQVQGKDMYNGDFNKEENRLLIFRLDPSAIRYGRLEGYNTSGVTYDYAHEGNVKYIIDKAVPDSIKNLTLKVMCKNDTIVYGTGNLFRQPTLDYFELTMIPDTIKHSEVSTIIVQGKDRNNTDLDPPEGTDIDFFLTRGGLYGKLLSPDSTMSTALMNIPYEDAKAGHFKFIANGEVPIEPQEVEVKVGAMVDEDFKEGRGKVVIQKGQVKLKITEPEVDEDELKVFDITDEPEMPTIDCKARLIGYTGEDNLEAKWYCKVSYAYPPKSDTLDFTEELTYDKNYESEWNLNFNNSSNIIGGKVKIKVSTEVEEKTYSDSIIVYIRGDNPDEDDVIEGLDNGEITMLETESDGFSQFDTEDYADPNEGLPLRGGDLHGWGLSQIDDRSHTINSGILWDWTANRTYGVNYYNQQRTGAQSRLEGIGHLDTPADGQTRQSMIDSEAYARYNGGPSAQYWSWDNTNGRWIVNATAIRNHRRIPIGDLRIHVGNYIDSY